MTGELICVDDGSTDNSRRVIESFGDKRIRVVNNESGQKGAAGARNYGVSVAKGEYIAFLDADDVWRPEKKLKKTLDFGDKKGAAFASYRI